MRAKPRLRRGCASPRRSRRRRGLLGCAGVSPARFRHARRRRGSAAAAPPSLAVVRVADVRARRLAPRPRLRRGCAFPDVAPKARTSRVRGRPRPRVCGRRGVGEEARPPRLPRWQLCGSLTCGRDAWRPGPAFGGVVLSRTSRRRRGLPGCAGVPARTFAPRASSAGKRGRRAPLPGARSVETPAHTPTPPKAGPGRQASPPARLRQARRWRGSAAAAPCSPAARSVETCGRDAWCPGSAPRPACRQLCGSPACGQGCPRSRAPPSAGLRFPRRSRRRRGLPGCAGVSPACSRKPRCWRGGAPTAPAPERPGSHYPRHNRPLAPPRKPPQGRTMVLSRTPPQNALIST